MTLAEIAGRIEERVRPAREEMAGLQEARDALTAAVTSPADGSAVTAPSTERRKGRARQPFALAPFVDPAPEERRRRGAGP
ncbi:MAG: hypothetical protein ACLP50_22985 [Solirubrobacteraceae bacterium]